MVLYIGCVLVIGLSAATNSEADPNVKEKLQTAQSVTVISWCPYRTVDSFSLFSINFAQLVLRMQNGFYVYDLISSPLAVLDS